MSPLYQLVLTEHQLSFIDLLLDHAGLLPGENEAFESLCKMFRDKDWITLDPEPELDDYDPLTDYGVIVLDGHDLEPDYTDYDPKD